jgi:hypothetical protein
MSKVKHYVGENSDFDEYVVCPPPMNIELLVE